jgi:hypothetical protein
VDDIGHLNFPLMDNSGLRTSAEPAKQARDIVARPVAVSSRAGVLRTPRRNSLPCTKVGYLHKGRLLARVS